MQWPVPENAFSACHCYLLRHQFLTIEIYVTRNVKGRSHINFQIKIFENNKPSGSRSLSVLFYFQKKKDSRTKLITFSKNWLIFKFKKSWATSWYREIFCWDRVIGINPRNRESPDEIGRVDRYAAWWLRTSSKFSGKEFEEIHRNIGSSETPKHVRIPPITK